MAVFQEKDKNNWTKDGRSWFYRCYYLDIYGNKKQMKSKKYKTKKETQEAERQFLERINTVGEETTSISFTKIYDEWIREKEIEVKSTTYYSIVNRSKYHILPFFDKFDINHIKVKNILNWREKIANTGISLGHQNTLIRTLREILMYAVENYDFNPKIVTKLKQYKIENVIDKTDAEYNYWTYDEFEAFIQNVDNDFYNLLFSFLYFTGLRSGEAIALTWNDIDFKRKTLRVNKSFSNKVVGGGYKIISPKTENSKRIIDLDDDLIDRLKQHKNEQEKIINFTNDFFVFGNVKYTPPTSLKNYLYKYIDKTNESLKNEHKKIKKITPHGFRHSHVSLLINLGCDSRDVAERIGDTIQTVEKVYYHMFPIKKKNTVTVLNNLKK